MLMQEFNEWMQEQKHPLMSDNLEENFGIFYQENQRGKSFQEMFARLAHQIYELQVCMEGLIEEQ